MREYYVYIIVWKCDNTEEVYNTVGERNGRINTLENQGYTLGEDFTLYTKCYYI